MIAKLYIKNFKIFKQCELPCSNLNILTGLNGTGKSTVVQSLLLLRQSFKDKSIASLKLKLEEDELCKIGTQKDALTQKVEDNIISLGFSIANQQSYIFDFITSNKDSTSDTIPNKNPNEYTDLDALTLFNNHFQYIGAERINPSYEHSYSKDMVEKRNQLSKIHGRCEYAVHYLGYKQKKDAKLTIKTLQHSTVNDDNLYSQVEAWLREISPFIKVKVDIDDRKQSVTLAYTYDIGDEVMEEVKPENTGFGISYALPIVVALLSAQAGDLIIIENPEAHLHPKGQSKLAELMCLAAQAGVQIFCETHSDHIVNGTLVSVYEHSKDQTKGISHENVNILFFRKKESEAVSEVVQIKPSASGRIKLPPKDFFDQFNIDLKRLIK